MFALTAKRTIRAAFSTLVLSALAACGGGSSDFDSDVTSGAAEGAPTLTSVEVTTTATGDVLEMGDIVTVTMKASENILAPSVSIAGDAADSVSGSGTDWSAEREMVPGDPDGLITITINFTDVSGASGTAVTTASIGSSFSFQNPDPLQVSQDQSDEFSGTTLSTDPDTGWSFENGDGSDFGIPGWGNNELQVYSEDQIAVVDGNLVITATESGTTTKVSEKSGFAVSQNTQGDFVSGRIRSNTVVDMSLPAGRVEVRAKMPYGQGIWPAIWMLPTQDVVDEYGSWPLTGEIDIVEAINLGVDGKQTIQSTIHYGMPFPDNSYDYVLYEPGLNPQDDFHIYAMEWENDPETGYGEIRFYFNDVHYASHSSDRWFAVQDNGDGTFTELPDPAPFDKTFNVMINLAVGGNLPGNPDDTTVFPQVLEVDYVRVFNCEFPEAGECSVGIDDSIVPLPSDDAIETEELVIFDNALDELWIDGVIAFDEAISFASCENDNGEGCPSLSWDIVDAEDTSRGQVYQVDYASDAQFAGMILGLNPQGVDLSNFSTGEVVFDLNVTSNPSDANFVMKVDCVDCPVDAGQREQNIGVPGVGWNEISVPVADLINASGGPGVGGLVIADVTTGLVLFPAFGSTAGVSYQIDNIRWIAGEDSGTDGGDDGTDGGDGGDETSPYATWGLFGGATIDAETGEFNFPSSAESWAGFSNTNADLYPFTFPNGGTVTFTGALPAGGSDVNVLFTFEADAFPDNEPNFSTTPVTVNSETETAYMVDIPAQGASQEFNSFLMYLVENDSPVIIKDVEVTVNEDSGSDDGDSGDSAANDGTTENPVINFDNALGTYNFTDFSDGTDPVTTLTMDPEDSMNTVAMTVKGLGTPTWAGTTLNGGLVVYPLTATDTIMTVRVYAPDTGMTVRLKVEESANAANFVETDAVTTVANEWETLTFDFGSPANGAINEAHTYDTLSIFFNFGIDGDTAGSLTFYWDDVTFVGGTGDSAVVGTGDVYADALDSQWADGLSAFDQAIGFSSCTNDGGAGCPSVNWSEVAAADVSRGTVLEVTYDGAAQFAGLIVGLEGDGLDMSNFTSGTVKFDLMVTANPSNANFIMKVDCVGCPTDAGQREQNLGTPTLASWDEFSIPVQDLINANGGPGSGGLVIDSVTTGLVIFPAFGSTAGVEYQIDNVRWVIEDSVIYDDALNSQWADGLSAFDQAIGFSSCTNDGGAGCPSVNWSEVAAADVSRGTVLEVTYDGAAQFAGLIVGLEADGLDLSDYASGNVKFDLMVTANPSSAAFIMKVDCVGCPTDAGQREQNLGTPTLNNWDEFSVPVEDLINANGGPESGGLVIGSTTTGLVIFPAFGSTAGVEYQIDNVRWTAE